MYFCIQQLKIFESRISKKKKKRKNIGPTKYPQEKISDPRSNQDKKFRTHETPILEKILDPRNNTHEKKNWTHEIPRSKNFRPTKHSG